MSKRKITADQLAARSANAAANTAYDLAHQAAHEAQSARNWALVAVIWGLVSFLSWAAICRMERE